jgi:transcription antitermination factor NusG
MEPTWESEAGGLANRDGIWLAAYTRPRHEEEVRAYCEQHDIEAFLPTYPSWREWSDRRKLLRLPLFPSYVFLRPDAERRRQAVQAPGMLWFVHDSVGPVPVPETDLQAVRRVLESGLVYDPLPGVQLEDEVEIIKGALRGCRGRLLRKDMGAIALTVGVVNGGVRIKLPDPSWVRPLPPPQDSRYTQ